MPRIVESGARIPSEVPHPAGAPPRTFTHIRAVDGLRALAIIGVVAYHTRPQMLRGGFLGVTLFLVVSGFFLTRTMLRLFDADEPFSYPTFLKGRLKRLWPSVLTTVGATAILVYACAPSLLPKARVDAGPSALFFSNWWYIFHHQSYFAASGLPSPLTHLWYTSLIMQFYVLWPVIFVVLMQLCRTKRRRILAIGALIALSTLDMALLAGSGAGISRAYYGLDTRSAELLVGALLAVLAGHGATPMGLRPPQWRTTLTVRTRSITLTHAALIDILGALCTVAFIVAFALCQGSDLWLYRGGLLGFAILSAALMWCSMQGGVLARVLGSKPMQYVGSRSFSLYLVHYPMLEVMNPATRTTPVPWYGWVGQFALILVVGEVFFQAVEAMHGTRLLPWIPRADGEERSHTPRRSALVAGGVGALIAVLLVLPLPWQRIADERARALRPELSMTAQEAKDRLKADAKASPSAKETDGATPSATPSPSATDTDSPTASPTGTPAPTPTASPTPQVQALVVPDNLDPSQWQCNAQDMQCSARLLMVGDSVTAGVAPVVQQHFPNARVDGAVSRQFWDGIPVLQQAMASGYDPQVIVYELGTNGTASAAQIDQVLDLAQGRPVYFTTLRAPVEWITGNNDLFLQVARSHPNVGVIDWSGLSGEHPEYMNDDGIHPNTLGQEAYVQMLYRAVCPQ